MKRQVFDWRIYFTNENGFTCEYGYDNVVRHVRDSGETADALEEFCRTRGREMLARNSELKTFSIVVQNKGELGEHEIAPASQPIEKWPTVPIIGAAAAEVALPHPAVAAATLNAGTAATPKTMGLIKSAMFLAALISLNAVAIYVSRGM